MAELTQQYGTWIDRAAATLALGGVIGASLSDFHVSTWQYSGSDFKTVYASAKCFGLGQRAYNFPNLEKIFAANHVILPASWYAHAPTYPPFTFAFLAPIVALPMVAAVYVWMAISALLLLFALWALLDAAARTFELGIVWRMVLIAFVAASPLVSFGLQIGNVSVAASALCILAVANRSMGTWLRALAIAASMLLKPHIALWLIVGMVLSRNREDRSVALRSCGLFAIALACYGAWYSLRLPFGLQLGNYTAMVRSEIATGCLNPRNHEVMMAAAEVTSVQSLVGYTLDTPWMELVSAFLLVPMAVSLAYFSRIAASSREGLRLELLGAWSVFGLLVTYHRSHDAIIVFLLLPWLLARLSTRRSDPASWGIMLLFILMAVAPEPPTFDRFAASTGLHALTQFVLLRQSAVAVLLMFLILLATLLRDARGDHAWRRRPKPSPDALMAA